jgi:DNA polymerase
MNLDAIAAEVRVCTRCPLHRERNLAVPGEGPSDARLMLVGEAPGKEEDLQGLPFVGRAGRVLDEVLQGAGLLRDRLFITSVVKCRPPRNRTPHRLEVDTCIAWYLRRQIEAIQPEIICLLGGVAAHALLGADGLAAVRGKLVRRERLFFPTFHPAGAGRNSRWRQAFAEDMARLAKMVKQGSGAQ